MSSPLPDPDTVESLKQFFDITEILEAWRKTAAALMSRNQEKITINSKSQDGRSAAGIELSSPEQKQEFVRACRQALYELDSTTYADPGYGRSTHLNLSTSPVQL